MEIRTLQNEEIPVLAMLAKEIWRECFSEILSPDQIEYMTDLFLSDTAIKENIKNGYLYRIVLEEDRMIGFTASKKEEDRTFLSKLYLLKSYRGNGFGRKMVEDVHDYFKQDRMYLTVNKHNRTYFMYLHLGFEVIEESVTEIGQGYVMDDYIMEKNFKK